MAELTKKLQVKVSSTTTPCKIYSISAEAGASYVRAKVDNVEAYIPLVDTSDSRASKVHIGSKCIATTGKSPYNKIEYKTPNTYTFTVPSGVTTLKVEVAGAGGGGGGGVNAFGLIFVSGGNGGRGELVSTVLEVIPSSTINIVVGKGGKEGSTSTQGNRAVAGNSGDNSSIATIVARGGGGGGRGYYYKNDRYEGSAGTSYGEGGIGGNGATKDSQTPTAGKNGWVIIEYGGDI